MSMLLVDTSVWIDHLRRGDEMLSGSLRASRVLSHPWVVGEIALGSLKNRRQVLDAMQSLPQAVQADAAEILSMIESTELYGKGLGFVDAALLASTRLTPHTRLWTRDRRLQLAAQTLGLAATVEH